LMGRDPFSQCFRMAWNESRELREALGQCAEPVSASACLEAPIP
jgi:hypothetical protein